jgi:hypothetical protein
MLWGSDEADKGREKEEKVVFRTYLQQLPKASSVDPHLLLH